MVHNKSHNLLYSYVMYKNCKNTNFKIVKVVSHIKIYYRWKALLNIHVWIFKPYLKMSTVLLLPCLHREYIVFQSLWAVCMNVCNSTKSDMQGLIAWLAMCKSHKHGTQPWLINKIHFGRKRRSGNDMLCTLLKMFLIVDDVRLHIIF